MKCPTALYYSVPMFVCRRTAAVSSSAAIADQLVMRNQKCEKGAPSMGGQLCNVCGPVHCQPTAVETKPVERGPSTARPIGC